MSAHCNVFLFCGTNSPNTHSGGHMGLNLLLKIVPNEGLMPLV